MKRKRQVNTERNYFRTVSEMIYPTTKVREASIKFNLTTTSGHLNFTLATFLL